MASFTTEFLRRALAYDGTQIGPLWAYREFGRQGDSLVAFVHPASTGGVLTELVQPAAGAH
jgi:hypothetical protein